MNQKTIGNNFESYFVRKLYNDGFWVYLTPNKASGQPVDIIACKNDRTYLIDCKTCSTHLFRLTRVEENQKNSIELFMKTGGRTGWFACLFNEQVYMIAYSTLKREIEKGSKSVNILVDGIAYEDWRRK